LRRATLALTLIPLAAGAVIYTSDADLAAKLQAFITRDRPRDLPCGE